MNTPVLPRSLTAMLAAAAVASATPGLPRKSQLREFTVTEPYLTYPIKNEAQRSAIRLSIDGEVVRFYNARLAPSADDIDWWAFEDLTAMKGKKLTLTISGVSDEVFGLITQSATVPGQETWGTESLRPQFHFSQKVGWINDPNGMVHYDGEWHLYFQHNPVGWKWDNMTWGHAVSTDLVNWRQLPNALHHRQGDAMFSGGAAVDWKNTGGWKTGEEDVIIVTWTSTGRGECIAYSNDRGRTFTEYEGNPIITHDGRDPKPLWYAYAEGDTPLSPEAKAHGGHWVIVVFNKNEELGGHLAFHTSSDLKKWTFQSRNPAFHECPELFTLPLDGDGQNTRWVLFGGDGKYLVGKFDGRQFTPEHADKHQLHYGNHYASQLFSEAPNGRRIQIGWVRGRETPGMPFNNLFTFPTELSLRTTSDGVRLFGKPVEEIRKIHGKSHRIANQPLGEGQTARLATSGHLFDIRATFEVGTAKRLGLSIDGKEAFAYDAANQLIGSGTLKPVDGRVSVRILIDRSLIETFVNDGRMIITGPFENSLDIDHIEAFATGGTARLVSLEVIELDASWK